MPSSGNSSRIASRNSICGESFSRRLRQRAWRSRISSPREARLAL
jgi:hypothetical protein